MRGGENFSLPWLLEAVKIHFFLPLLIEIIKIEHSGISPIPRWPSSTKDYTSRCVPASSPHEPASLHPADLPSIGLCGYTTVFHSRWHAARWHRFACASRPLSHRAGWAHQRDLCNTTAEHSAQTVRIGHHYAGICGCARPHQHDRAW